MRLSVYCAEKFKISRRQVKEAIKNGLISIDKSIITKDIEITGTENIKADFNVKQLFPEYSPLSRLDYEADGIIGMIHKDTQLNNISKSYYAFVNGEFPEYIELSKKIDADNKKKVKVLDDNTGFPAVMKRIKFNGKISLIEVTLEKAARHQVRAFSAYLNHSIIGDKLYNGLPFERLCLHCFKYTINNKTFYCQKQTEIFLQIYNQF